MFAKKKKNYYSLNDYFSEPNLQPSRTQKDTVTAASDRKAAEKKPVHGFVLRLLFAIFLFLGGLYLQTHPFELFGISGQQLDAKLRENYLVEQLEQAVENLLQKD